MVVHLSLILNFFFYFAPVCLVPDLLAPTLVEPSWWFSFPLAFKPRPLFVTPFTLPPPPPYPYLVLLVAVLSETGLAGLATGLSGFTAFLSFIEDVSRFLLSLLVALLRPGILEWWVPFSRFRRSIALSVADDNLPRVVGATGSVVGGADVPMGGGREAVRGLGRPLCLSRLCCCRTRE